MSIPRLQMSSPLIPTPTSWVKALRAAASKPVKPNKPAKAPQVPQVPLDERDAAGGLIDGQRPSAPLRQAYADLGRGVKDTSRAPEADRAYEKLKR